MKILITGAKGFVGKNLAEALKCIRDGKDRTRGDLKIDEVYEYDMNSVMFELKEYCKKADFVFNLAGVNRPEKDSEFMEGNFGFAETLLNELKKNKNTCPVMLASSIQAALTGRFKDSEYGKSKLAGEELFLKYGEETGSRVLIYRFPNLFGKWARPNYNSAVATFCYNTANSLSIKINDRDTRLTLLYIDDLINELIRNLTGEENRCDYDGERILPDENGKYLYVPVTHEITLGEIADLLNKFADEPKSLKMPDIPEGSFAKKLYSTYLSYLPEGKVSFPLKMNKDERGSFTELLKTENAGQFSVNISKPGVTKGEHWHNTKWEFFIVVSGKALIKERKIGSDEVMEFYVSGDKIEAVHMLPGYTHNIINLSETEDLITLMWANESFDKEKPDTFYEKVEE